jgi:hypothetical protein
MSLVPPEKHVETYKEQANENFPQRLSGLIMRTCSDEGIRLIARILRFPGLERD